MRNKISTYVTSDDKVFRTACDMGDVDTKLYTLYHLEMAEKKFQRKSNRTMQSALNSTETFAKKNENAKHEYTGSRYDKYGLDKTKYTEEQIKYIHNKIDEYNDAYKPSEPFEKDSIISLAKTALKISEMETKMMTSDNPKDISALKDLRDMFLKNADSLKMMTKQKDKEDPSKHRTSLAQIIYNYEERKRTGKTEVSEKTDEMEEKMAKERADAIDGRYSDVVNDA